MSTIKASTDYQYLKRSVKYKIKAFTETNQGIELTDVDLNGIIDASYRELKVDMKLCGITPLTKRELKKEIKNEFVTQVITLVIPIEDDDNNSHNLDDD